MRHLPLLLVVFTFVSVKAQKEEQLQNTRDIHQATGGRLVFRRILVNGVPREEYIPVKEDYIKRID